MGEWIHAYAWLSPFAVDLKLSQHCSLAILQYKTKKKSWTLLHRGPTSSGQKDTSILVTKGDRRWSWADSSQEPTLSQQSVYKTLLGKSLSRGLGENRGK